MNRLIPAVLILALAGCSTAREAMGRYAAMADKGIEVGVGDPAPAPDAATVDAQGKPIPGGLVGDTANRAYTTDPATPPRSS